MNLKMKIQQVRNPDYLDSIECIETIEIEDEKCSEDF